MRWAAENPEAYAAIERAGVRAKLTALVQDAGFTGADGDTLEMLCVTMQDYAPAAWSSLVALAHREIGEAWAEHLTKAM